MIDILSGFVATAACGLLCYGLYWLTRRGVWGIVVAKFRQLWRRLRGKNQVDRREDDVEAGEVNISKSTTNLDVDPGDNPTPNTPLEPLALDPRPPLEMDVRPPLVQDERPPLEQEEQEALEVTVRPPLEGPPPPQYLEFDVDQMILRPGVAGRSNNLFDRRQ